MLTTIENERKALEEEWGKREVPEVDLSQRPQDVIRKHDESQGISLLDKGVASTTKKIVQSAIASRMNLMKHDDVLK